MKEGTLEYLKLVAGGSWTGVLVNTNTRTIDGSDTLCNGQPYVCWQVQINLNDGKKRKYLYFQTDYVVRP